MFLNYDVETPPCHYHPLRLAIADGRNRYHMREVFKVCLSLEKGLKNDAFPFKCTSTLHNNIILCQNFNLDRFYKGFVQFLSTESHLLVAVTARKAHSH